MDMFKDKANDLMSSGGLDSQVKDINFPAGKDQVLRQLEQKGVPSQVLDRVRNADTSQFDSADDVMSTVKSFM